MLWPQTWFEDVFPFCLYSLWIALRFKCEQRRSELDKQQQDKLKLNELNVAAL